MLNDHDENERLNAVRSLRRDSLESKAAFDKIVELASSICDTPICLISIVDQQKLWFMAQKGLNGVEEMPRSTSFCSYAILGNDLMILGDTSKDRLFSKNPYVTGNPYIRFTPECRSLRRTVIN